MIIGFSLQPIDGSAPIRLYVRDVTADALDRLTSARLNPHAVLDMALREGSPDAPLRRFGTFSPALITGPIDVLAE